MLTDTALDQILARIPTLTLGVLGDLFLDRYLDIDAGLTEPSIETGLDAYQVVGVRACPGAAGTILNNLAALGVGRLRVVSVLGDDGEGHELRQALDALTVVDRTWVATAGEREFRTPTYTKPLLHAPGQPARELNRLDIKNRKRLAAAAEQQILRGLNEVWPRVDALVVLDQVSEVDCGVVTTDVRRRLAELGAATPDKMILADSRERIGDFRSIWLKPNRSECVRAVQGDASAHEPIVEECVRELARRTGRPVFCTSGEHGIVLADPRRSPSHSVLVPGYPASGPIDIVGAGDSTSAGIACAVAAGARLEEAAAFGNLVASITIQQLGTTGTASPHQVRERWQQVRNFI